MRHGPHQPLPLSVHPLRSSSPLAHARLQLKLKTARSKTTRERRHQTARQTTRHQQPRNRRLKSQQRTWVMKNQIRHRRQPHCPLGSQLRRNLLPHHLPPREIALNRQDSLHYLRRATACLTGRNFPIDPKHHTLAEVSTWIGLGNRVTIEEMRPAIQETIETLATDETGETGEKLGIHGMAGMSVILANLTHATTASRPVRGITETTEQEILGQRDPGTSLRRSDAPENQTRGTRDDLTGTGRIVANHHHHDGMIMHRLPTERTARLGTDPSTDPAATTLGRRESMLCRPHRQLLRQRTMFQSLRSTLTACGDLMRATGLIS